MARSLSLALALLPATAAAAPPAVTAAAYHPEGKSVAFGLAGEVRLFDPATGAALGKSSAVPGRVTALAFDPRGKWLAAASGETGKSGEVRLSWLAADGSADVAAIVTITGHKDAVYALAFSPDGKTLATAGYDRVIHLWDVPFGLPADSIFLKKPRLTLQDHSDTVYALAFHPGGELLASASADRAVKVWDAATGKKLHTLGESTDWVYCLAWSPDKKHLAAGGVDKTVRVWAVNNEDAKLVASAFAHEKAVWRLAYSPDGRTLFTAGEDAVIKAWDAAKFVESKVFPAQPDTILDLAVRPDGKQLAVARFDGAAVLLDTATGKPAFQPLPAKAPPAPPEAPKAAPPKPGKLAPDGGVRGKTTSVTVTGTDLHLTSKVTADSADVEVKLAAEVSPNKLALEVAIKPGAAVGAVKLTFEGTDGKSAPITFAIDRFTVVPEAGTSDSARVAQQVKVPVTVAGAVDRAGDADYFRFTAAAGDEVGVQAVVGEIGSKLDPVLVLADAAGTVLAEGAGVLGYRVPKAGTYSVGIRDRDYRGGADFTYRLHVGSVPVVTGVFPLAAQRGRTTEVHVEGVNLGTSIAAKVTVPADARAGSRVAVPLPDGADRPLGKAEVVVGEFPSVVTAPVDGADLRVPGSADGILTKPAEVQHARFTAKKGERLVVEVLARRAGSPVDPVIEILDSSGKPVPRAVLRATSKTVTVFRDHDSVGPGIRIEAWNDLAINDYLLVDGELMRIVALPRNPDDDCQFYQVAGQRVGYLGTTPAHHAQGAAMYKVEIHPPGSTFQPNGLPVFPVFYRNDDGGAGYGKDSFLMFEAPADGAYQVRVTDARGSSGPAHAYRLTVRPPRADFSVNFNPTAPAVRKGGGIPIGVTVTRTDGFDGPVRVKFEGLPPGFDAPETFVEGGHTTTAFTLFAAEDATVPPNAKLKLVARAEIGGKEVVREAAGGAPSLRTDGDILTRTRVSEITIRPGHETKFTVDIERQGKFAGRVPLEVRGLPHGVRVLNIGLNGVLITERETSREVVLYAEPWVKPMRHPIVVTAKSERSNTDHAAKSVQLKVEADER